MENLSYLGGHERVSGTLLHKCLEQRFYSLAIIKALSQNLRCEEEQDLHTRTEGLFWLSKGIWTKSLLTTTFHTLNASDSVVRVDPRRNLHDHQCPPGVLFLKNLSRWEWSIRQRPKMPKLGVLRLIS